MNKRRIYGIIFIVLSFILAMTPKHIAPVCSPSSDGKVMKCHYMGNAVMAIAIVLIILAIIFMILKDNRIALGLVYSNIAMGVLAILMPLKIIGTCMSPTMSCNAHTKPTIILVSGIYILINIIYLLRHGKEN